MRLKFAALVLLLVAGAASAAQPDRQPTGPWTVDYNESQCVASREYGSPQSQLTLALKPSPHGGVMRIALLWNGRDETKEVAGAIKFDDRPAKKMSALSSTDRKTGTRLLSLNLSMSEFDANLDATSVSLDFPAVHERLALTSLPELVAQLDACLHDLQTYWNTGAAPAIKLAHPPTPVRPIGSFLSANDYPSVALMANEQGNVLVSFLVDQKGHVADCSVEHTSDFSSLDAMTCFVLQTRVQFVPATDRDGKPVRSASSQEVSWKLE